jgi:DNA polymerase elongation subunit (family B)
MVVDFEYSNKILKVSYIGDNGQIKMKHYNWPNPQKYVVCSDDDKDKSGKYTTWDGNAVKLVYTRNPDRYSVYDYLDNLPPEEQEIIFKYNEPEIFFIDIENEILDSKPTPQLAQGAIQSISIVVRNKVLVMGTCDLTKEQEKSIKEDINNYFVKFNTDYDFKFIRYKNEYDMMLNFFEKYVPKMPVITGWNFTEYDWVYLVNRARKIGVDPTSASLTRVLKQPFNKMSKAKNQKESFCEHPAHKVVVDYMELYEKYNSTIKIKESNSLDFVADGILGIKKVNYEGSLKTLINSDYKKFIFYNAVDSILVQKIHETTKWVDILYGISTLSKIKILDAYSTLPVTEGILRRKLKKEKNVILCKLDRDFTNDTLIVETERSVKGGWVKDPVKGMAMWVACYDFSSLYPTTIRQFNISADSYKGVLSPTKDFAIFNGHRVELEDGDIVLLNGTVFKNEIGIVNQTMTDIFADRKKYKGYMNVEHEDLEMFKKELKTLEEELLLCLQN